MPSNDSHRGSLRRKEFTPSGSAVRSGRKDLAGLSLDDILGNESKPPPPPLYSHSPSHIRRTLWEILRDQEPRNRSYKELNEHRDRKAWRRFKDRLRLQHADAVGRLSLEVPASDLPFCISRSFSSHTQKRNHQRGSRSDKFSRDRHIMAEENYCGGDDQVCDPNSLSCSRPGMMRRASSRYGAPVPVPSESDQPMPASTPEKASLGPQMMRPNSTRMGSMRRDSTKSSAHSESSLLGRDDPDFFGYGGSESGRLSQRILPTSTDDRLMSAREAVAAQEASEAEAAVARDEEQNEGLIVQEMTENQQQLRMSLMDLLEETDRQMGYTGSSDMTGEEEDDDDDDDDVDEDGNNKEDEEESGEHSCSMCLVKHKGAPSGACGHLFCKLCSKELWVGNGNCPACNNFNLEMIEVF